MASYEVLWQDGDEQRSKLREGPDGADGTMQVYQEELEVYGQELAGVTVVPTRTAFVAEAIEALTNLGISDEIARVIVGIPEP